MFCIKCGTLIEKFFVFCKKCGLKVDNDAKNHTLEASKASGGKEDGDFEREIIEKPLSFKEFHAVKEKQRAGFFRPNSKGKRKRPAQSENLQETVKINVGVMLFDGNVLKKQRGKSIMMSVKKATGKEELLKISTEKHSAHNSDLINPKIRYTLLYPDGSEVEKLKENDEEFVLYKYKAECGQPYHRISFFLCPTIDFSHSSSAKCVEESDPEDNTESDDDDDQSKVKKKNCSNRVKDDPDEIVPENHGASVIGSNSQATAKSAVANMRDKYGEGTLFDRICVNCGSKTEGLYSSGVHESPNGCLRVYSEDEEFVCQKCGTGKHLSQDTEKDSKDKDQAGHSSSVEDNGKSSKKEAETYQYLQEMFPSKDEKEIKAAFESTDSVENAITELLASRRPTLNDAYASVLISHEHMHLDENDYEDDNFTNQNLRDFVPECDLHTSYTTDPAVKELLEQQRQKEFTCNNDQFIRLKIRRQTVWEDTKFKFDRITDDDLKMPLRVQFIGEPAVDYGGPSREFYYLINTAAQQKLVCEGVFQHNVSSLNKDDFKLYGKITALGLMQGFTGPKCFQKTVAGYIVTGSLEGLNPSIEEIPNSKVRESLKALSALTDEEEFKNEATFNSDFRFDAGYSKPFVHLEDKTDFLRSIALHYVLLSSITEANQYIEGLKTCGILGLIQANPEKFRKVFTIQKELTADVVDDIFAVKYSPRDSNKFQDESKVIFNFTQYLEDIEKERITSAIEGEEVAVTLKHVLQFITGSDGIPAIGFTPRPSIHFNHTDPTRKLTANTCANQLTLTVDGSDYEKFSEDFTFCMFNSPGFGLL